MSGFEDRFILHSQPGQIIGIKKTAVINIIRGDSPIGQAKSLRFNKFVELVETGGIGGSSIDEIDRIHNTGDNCWRSRAQLSQPALVDFLIAIALRDALAVSLLSCRQVAESGDEALKLQQVWVLLAQGRRKSSGTVLQDAGILTRVHGEG